VWLPPVVSAGDFIRLSVEPVSSKKPAPEPELPPLALRVEGRPTLPVDGKNALRAQLPVELSVAGRLDIAVIGEAGVRLDYGDVRVLPKPPSSSRPHFDLCGPQVTTNAVICLCGWFPDETAWRSLLVDGKPALPLAASSRSACLRMSEGSHRITGSAPSFNRESAATVDYVKISEDKPNKVVVNQPYTYTWTVVGTSRPVRLRVRNLTPGILRLEGGDDQVISTSGGRSNSISRAATMTSSGPSHIQAEMLADDSPFYSKAYLEMLGEIFAQRLSTISRKFAESVQPFSGDQEEIETQVALIDRLLQDTRADIHRSLPFPELAAFRVYVDALFDKALTAMAAHDSDIRLAALPSPRTPAEEKSSIKLWLERITQFLEWIPKQSLARHLLVRTVPVEGASFEIHPKTYSSYTRSTSTNYAICNIPLGRYDYTVTRDGFQTIRDLSIDLMQETQQVFECPLRPKGKEPGACGFRAGSVKDCQ